MLWKYTSKTWAGRRGAISLAAGCGEAGYRQWLTLQDRLKAFFMESHERDHAR